MVHHWKKLKLKSIYINVKLVRFPVLIVARILSENLIENWLIESIICNLFIFSSNKSYNLHKQCITEDEKYGNKTKQTSDKPTESKGQIKQEQWVNVIY